MCLLARLLLASACCALVDGANVDSVSFPKYASAVANDIRDPELESDAEFCFALTEADGAAQLRDRCGALGAKYVQVLSCDRFCCTSGTRQLNEYARLTEVPSLQLCNNQLRIGSADVEPPRDVVYTYLRSSSNSDADSAYANLTYVGCVSRKLVLALGSGLARDAGIRAYHMDTENEEVQWVAIPPHDFRVWDLEPGCHSKWFYMNGGADIPLAAMDEPTMSVFCTDPESCGAVSLQYGRDPPLGGTLELPVDYFWRRQGLCVNQADVEGDPFETTIDECLSRCGNEGHELALFDPDGCRCGSVEDGTLPTSVYLHVGDNLCLACADNEDLECGGGNGGLYTYTSAYVTDGRDQSDFEHWHCVRWPPFNDPDDVLDRQLLQLERNTATAAECLSFCSNVTRDTAVIMASDARDGSFTCKCLAYYKFRMLDMSDSCLTYWCPPLTGPCVDATDSPSYASVYCRGDDCHGLLLDNAQTDICSPGERRALPSGLLSPFYFECRLLGAKFGWSRMECDEHHFFIPDKESGTCVSATCNQTDAHKLEWFGVPGKNTTKACFANGSPQVMQWFCRFGPNFDTPQPDRSSCVQDWINEVENEIAEGKNATEISSDIVSNLEEVEVVGGGDLIELSSLLGDLVELRGNQTDVAGYDGETFSFNLFRTVDILLGSVSAWQEVHDSGARFGASSQLLLAVDAGGHVELSAVSAGCRSYSMTAPKYRHLTVHMSKYEGGAGAEAAIAYSGHEVSIDVPESFVTDADGCVRFVASTYSVDVEASEMFPDAPSVAEHRDHMRIGLHGNTVSFTGAQPFQAEKRDQKEQVTITFHHKSRRALSPSCNFWDDELLSWNVSGCELDGRRSTVDVTVCKCNHLTNFAVIFGSPDADSQIKSILSIALGSLSCGCLVITLFYHHWYKLITTQRSLVELNRNYCLLLGHFLFISLVGLEDIPFEACYFITAMTHYVWTAVFSWTVVEGLLLYRALHLVFHPEIERTWVLFVFAYGSPAVVVMATVIPALASPDYESYIMEDACWLNGNYLWGFLGPVAATLAFNTVMLVVGMVSAQKVAKIRRVGTWQKFRAWARNLIILSFLLGLTWLLGFFVKMWSGIEFAFIVVNASSGLWIVLQSVVFSQRAQSASRRMTLTSMKSTSMKSTNMSSSVRKLSRA